MARLRLRYPLRNRRSQGASTQYRNTLDGRLAAAFAVKKCGIGVDDWETMFFASAALLSQEQAFLRWIMGDVDNLSVPKLHHHRLFSSQPPAVEFDVATTGIGFGIVDPVGKPPEFKFTTKDHVQLGKELDLFDFDSAAETRGVLKIFLENVIRDAITYTEHARRKTVTTMDVVFALKRQNDSLQILDFSAYSSNDAVDLRFVAVLCLDWWFRVGSRRRSCVAAVLCLLAELSPIFPFVVVFYWIVQVRTSSLWSLLLRSGSSRSLLAGSIQLEIR
ncbi:hypothetical protein KSP40_PGU020268 [Platanthera guangdongensis]|uniref:Histone H4 n=1 Tax=Platanthera guangdongensis TaxID=2320717 RepID=A0ABR2LEU5_9ASPA